MLYPDDTIAKFKGKLSLPLCPLLVLLFTPLLTNDQYVLMFILALISSLHEHN